ncbi:MAG: glycosyltransferase family 2 protein [Lachnospiraceae bacterium]|nr:glycosyltransferase family 2 protein [Lachnospiraceae bacterium]
MEEKISVIVPVYKVEKYLERCIDSILAQSYGNLEIILVDDGSPDCCPEICDQYQQKDKRIQVIHRENGGLAAARNSAIERATGEYLVFVDSDDQVDRDYIKNLYQIIIRYQADLGICGYEDQYEGKELPFSTDIKMEETVCFDRLEGLKALLYQVPFDNSMWAKIYRKPLFDGLRMPQGRLYEDFAIMYRLFYRADRVVYNPYRGYGYLHRKDGIMEEQFSLRKMDLIDFAEEMKEKLIPCCPQLESAIWSRYFRANCHIYLQIPDGNGFAQQRRRIEKNLKESRKWVLKDSDSRFGTKGAAFCTYLGFPLFRKLKKWKGLGKR